MINRQVWLVQSFDGSEARVVAESLEKAARVARDWWTNECPDENRMNPFDPEHVAAIVRKGEVDAVDPDVAEPLTPEDMNRVTAEVELINVAVMLADYFFEASRERLERLERLEADLNRIRELWKEVTS